MLRSRVLSAIVMLPLVLIALHFGGMAWLSIILLVSILGWREITKLLRQDHFIVVRLVGLLFVVAFVVEAYLRASGVLPTDLLRPLLAGLFLISLTWALFDQSGYATTNWAMTIASVLYMGFMFGHFVTLRQRPDGLHWTLLALLLTWINDALAYFVGTAWGRHKLWPRLSPKKSWEGTIGGLVGVLIAGGLLGPYLVGIPSWLGVLLGLLVVGAATFGDLAISLLKRTAHVKDSSNLIPGHGGMLDRADSLMFAVPITTYFALIVAGA